MPRGHWVLLYLSISDAGFSSNNGKEWALKHEHKVDGNFFVNANTSSTIPLIIRIDAELGGLGDHLTVLGSTRVVLGGVYLTFLNTKVKILVLLVDLTLSIENLKL